MIVINCTGHSGFTVESETHMLIFDYSEGTLPKLPAKKKIYVFISHGHEDHFNPDIFSLCREHPNVRYVVSSDIPVSILRDCGVTDPIIAEPGMDIRPESRFRLKVLPSTDLGVAYLAGCMGRNIFHAGDLNLWLWQGMSEGEVFAMTNRFREYTRGLKNFWIDTAFLPLDTRQGIYSFLGFDYYMKHFRIKNAIPMHFFGSSKIVDDLMYDRISRDYRSRIIKLDPGGKVNIV
ncbi:MAG: MBL fold metallo-hydrolase [Ruminococcaceae bacterium]|nr:MBL fold metallo-hydrolase [Oscillospiraceae bacterium]